MTPLLPHSDQKYIDALLNGDDQLLHEIYQKFFSDIKRMVIQNSGNAADAEDLFNEVLVEIWKKAQRKTLTLTCPFNYFLYDICRKRWLNKLKKRNRSGVTFRDINGYENIQDVTEETLQAYTQEENCLQIILKNLKKLSAGCQELIELWAKGISIKERAQKLNLSENYTNKKTSECKKKLKEKVKGDPEFKDICFD